MTILHYNLHIHFPPPIYQHSPLTTLSFAYNSSILAIEDIFSKDLDHLFQSLQMDYTLKAKVVNVSISDEESSSLSLNSKLFPPHSIEIPLTTVHLFKDNNSTTTTTITSTTSGSTLTTKTEIVPSTKTTALHSQSNTLCFIGIHSTTSVQEFISILHPFTPSHIRLVHVHPDRYIVLIKCNSDQECTDMLQKFSQSAHMNLTVLLIDSVTFGENVDPNCFPSQFNKDSTELPTCPVCLDRMDDSVTGIVTSLCQHSFHAKCLEKWQDSSCPVCRFTHQYYGPANECIECSTEDNLWICLICGKIGCGRYKAGHAENHFKQTNHIYSLEMETQRVWDYVGEEYVHRLVRNKVDGKIIETNGDKQDKYDSSAHIVMEYTHLLSSQMDSQRDFYESKLESCESDYASHIMDVNLRLDEESSKLRASEQTNHLNLAKIEKLVKKVGLTLKQKEDEETMNQILRKDRQTYKENILRLERVLRVKDEQVNELQEQVRDLMFFVESREKIDNDPELMNATIVHVDLPT